jgi:hypothetical protein
MTMPNLTVRHGWLHEVSGTLVTWDGVSIAAARIALKGHSFSRTHTLAEHITRQDLPREVRSLMLNGYDAPWVRGRIERLFYTALTLNHEERLEKSGLQATLIAVVCQGDDSLIGVPFSCTDYYLKSGLMFSETEDPPPGELADRIAAAFWNLLLAVPHDLPSYTDQMYHVGAGVWLVFGIACGQPYIEERQQEPRRGPRNRR